MRKVIAVLFLMLVVCGCATVKKNYILTESEQYYFIPAGTPFNAVIVKGQAPVEVRRVKDTWGVDAGYLAKLQEEANAAVIKPK